MSLRIAVREALKNPIEPKGRNSISRFAAVLTDGKGQTFVGLNSYKSHPLQYRFSRDAERSCIHAEVAAKACRNGPYVDLSSYTMYVARVLRDGTPGLAKPCMYCWGCIEEFGVGRVEWTE